MSGRLSGKRALITAAGQGIGRASAIAMAREGAFVFATDVNSQALEKLSEEIKGVSETFALDVRDQTSVAAGVKRAQPDILFNVRDLCTAGLCLRQRMKIGIWHLT